MVAKNDITGDKIQTKSSSGLFQDNFDSIFRKPSDDSTSNPNESNSDSERDTSLVTVKK